MNRRALQIGTAALVITATAATAVGAGASSVSRSPVQVQVVASGLDAPKHLTYTSKGLYAVESGTGGPVGAGNCISGPAVEGTGRDRYCVGATGAVVRINGLQVQVAASGLASEVDTNIGQTTGPSAVSVSRTGRLTILYQDDQLNSDGTTNLPAPARGLFGTLQIPGRRAVDIARFEARHPQDRATLGGTPGETSYDSDPYDVIPYRSGYAVTDAAANRLLDVTRTGAIRVLAHFPAVPETVPAGRLGPKPVRINAQAVPTSVALGPDGALYVGILRGVPSRAGTAYIFRVVPGHAATVWAKGLSAVTAIAFDPRGRLLATEFSAGGLLAASTVPGALVRVSRDGRTVTTLPVSGLSDPTGVAVAPNGTVWVANNGTHTGTAPQPGEVLRITGLQ